MVMNKLDEEMTRCKLGWPSGERADVTDASPRLEARMMTVLSVGL